MRASNRGFTLIELMVVVALAAIMLGLGLPSFKDFILGQRVKTAAADFATAAIYARSEAIKRGVNVGMVAATGGWKNGWNVQAAGGANSDWSIVANRVTLSSQQAFQGLDMTSVTTSAEIVFLRNGRMLAQIDGVKVAGTDGSHPRCVSFDLSGLPKSRLGAC